MLVKLARPSCAAERRVDRLTMDAESLEAMLRRVLSKSLCDGGRNSEWRKSRSCGGGDVSKEGCVLLCVLTVPILIPGGDGGVRGCVHDRGHGEVMGVCRLPMVEPMSMRGGCY